MFYKLFKNKIKNNNYLAIKQLNSSPGTSLNPCNQLNISIDFKDFSFLGLKIGLKPTILQCFKGFSQN